MAVLAGNSLIFTEGTNLDSDNPEDCPATDLYRYDLAQKTETRIAEISCVINLLSDGKVAYVITKDAQKVLSVGRITDEKTLEIEPEGSLARMIAKVAFKRSILKLPKGSELKQLNYVIRDNELNAVFKTDTHLFLDAVIFDQASKQPVLPFELKNGVGSSVGLSDGKILYALTAGDGAWLRVVEMGANGASATLGHPRPLAKDWTKAGVLEWAVRKPRFLVGVPDGFLVADRTPEVFSEATAISWYCSTEKQFYRLNIPDQDVGGLSYVHGGVLVSKPMAGSIVWYGNKSPFQTEVKK